MTAGAPGSPDPGIHLTLQDLCRREVPHVLGALARRYRELVEFGRCEDAVQEALLAAFVQWPRDGLPENPRGWLVRVAQRRLVDAIRSDRSRLDREDALAAGTPGDAWISPAADAEPVGGAVGSAVGSAVEDDADDAVQLLLLCCHPAVPAAAGVALTLRAVGGLSTAQIAAAFLVPTATMGQRISRAKTALLAAGARFDDVPESEMPARLAAVLQVIYLVFNEGYATSAGDRLVDVSLTGEALRLIRMVRRRFPADTETVGLLALMVLTDARTAARTDDRGDLIPLARQDRSRWDRALIAEGVVLLEAVLPRGAVGPFQLQAAIAAVHADASSADDTDWEQIVVLYRMLDRLTPGPMVTLNLAVAVGMAEGPAAGLRIVEPLLDLPAMARHHRTHAVLAHLLDMDGRRIEAAEAFATAARLTASLPEQRYLNARVRRADHTNADSTAPD